MMRRRTAWLALMAGMAIAIAGCGPQGASVSGHVTLDGVALETGTVQFRPTRGGPAASGSIGPGGRFTLAVGATQGAVPPGGYVATVVALGSSSAASAGSAAEALPKLITPQRYGDITTSGLTFDIVPGRNDVAIQLVTDPRATGRK